MTLFTASSPSNPAKPTTLRGSTGDNPHHSPSLKREETLNPVFYEMRPTAMAVLPAWPVPSWLAAVRRGAPLVRSTATIGMI